MLGVVVLYAGVWWAWSLRLPHAAASLLDFIPGAIVFGLGLQVVHLVAVYYLAARLTHASALYGTLGVAAALLFGLYLIGRLIIASVVFNVAVWSRKHAMKPSAPPAESGWPVAAAPLPHDSSEG